MTRLGFRFVAVGQNDPSPIPGCVPRGCVCTTRHLANGLLLWQQNRSPMSQTPIHIRIGESSARLLVLLGCSIGLAHGAPFVCTPTAVPALVHAEGIAERLGDILISCAVGTPSGVVGGNLTVFLNVAVTNKLINNFPAVQITVDKGTGPSAAKVRARLFLA